MNEESKVGNTVIFSNILACIVVLIIRTIVRLGGVFRNVQFVIDIVLKTLSQRVRIETGKRIRIIIGIFMTKEF